ncbi:hypothetical protein FMA36_17800 (plasmid) [Komagataeibacter xylinus]|uniref:Uncharacterized protein n=1 Tax=Komagataeibacter xylinus TaxID=28448 RepID=A0A857FSQ0_KOMXY|nr:hypothetical protein FMA36_17800 [Komagataeibacter xylinus]
MTALHTRFDRGYHGCSKEIGRKLINEESAPTPLEMRFVMPQALHAYALGWHITLVYCVVRGLLVNA